MITKQEKIGSLIFDGDEQDVISRSFQPDTKTNLGGAIAFDDFINHDFEDLQGLIGDDDFASIVKTGNFTRDSGFLHQYHGSDNLKLYFCQRDKTIVVFAYGEFQPTRYKLYLEGVWVIK
ncbi:hypothetical protein G7092_13710 [Mucilaginibacter sp. HC2]|uniref:hypothetical protein n=1 Tax=Mucilaginibacter inviolabilis TaxID=2714892 RepID=UPI00140E7C94|nr:hypothetical protein [Mucilaginibacter inviolabilis]NHA04862.1 hypothetical protein [Mucilaginibacter inviolabilis]